MFDTGNTAFMLLAASLVMLMTPGLAFFYGGLVGRKNVLAIMIQSFVSMGVTTVLWFVCGYSLCFSGDVGGIIGNLDNAFFRGMHPMDAFSGSNTIPVFVFCTYQMMFAIITPALITGAFANRVRFGAYIIFLVAWLLFVYFPAVHMIWGGGVLQQWGVQDFAGGIVVHAIAGFAALASVIFVGPRKIVDKGPHSIPLVALGTGLLWFGWYGFNAGSQLKVDGVTGLAFLNTDVAASFAAVRLAHHGRDLREEAEVRRPAHRRGRRTRDRHADGRAMSSTGSAVIIGTLAGVVCYFAIWIKNRAHWDDALDVWGVHGVGGCLGTILLGFFASKAVNAASADGLFYGGGGGLLGKQLTAVVGFSVYAFLFTYAMLWLINTITPVRVTEKEEESGLDESLHGEQAYI